MNALDCDVAIVGAGPTGLMLANLLGVSGVRVIVIERNLSTVQEPRAVTIDDETLRTIQAAGLIEEATADIALDCGSFFLAPNGSCFAKVHPTSRENGFPRRNSFSQILLEATLRRGLDRFPHVTALFGHNCEAVIETQAGVSLSLRDSAGKSVTAQAVYAVGCDGGKSLVREAIGASMGGSTYQQRWIVIDLGATKEKLRQTRIFCDPTRPGITLPGPHGVRRYEFMLRDGEVAPQAESERFVRDLLASHGPDGDAPIVRSRIYTFHARVADRWQTERLFVAGDAAHLSPPFGGLGMNSGIRDSHNLAWKLAETVKGRLSGDVLKSYAIERAPHAEAMVRAAVNIGKVMMPTSRIRAALIRNGLRAAGLVPPLQSYFAQMKYKPKPYYVSGFLVPDPAGTLVGRLLPQPTLECASGRSRLDDLVGDQFAVIAYGAEAERSGAAIAKEDFGMDVARIAILPSDRMPDGNPRRGLVVGRDLGDVLGRLRREGGAALILLRPDRHVAISGFGSPEGIRAFVASARTLLQPAKRL